MSILAKIRETYLAAQTDEKKTETAILVHLRRGGRGHGTGWPTGSATGKCTAQMQLLRFPELSQPEPFPLRSLMTFDEGRMIEAWWAYAVESAFPSQSGLSEELFYYPVPMETKDLEQLVKAVARPFGHKERIWGSVIDNFQPPVVIPNPENKVRARISHLVDRDKKDQDRFERETRQYQTIVKALGSEAEAAAYGILPPRRPKPKALGFVVDQAAGCVWAPVYIDRMLYNPAHEAITVLEKKSMSNFAFRRALTGTMGYGERCQLVAIHRATNLPVTWLLYRKETAHLCEIFYTREAERVLAIITKSNGQEETFFGLPGDMDHLETPDGGIVDLPPDVTWETAEVWTPYEDRLFAEIQERVRRVLLHDGSLNVFREYGPDFTCPTCNGTGTQTHQKNNKAVALKAAKKCEDCKAEDGKPVGLRERVQLPNFPCGYCPVWRKCWEKASPELEITDKPRIWVTLVAFKASGLDYTPPPSTKALPVEAVVSEVTAGVTP